MEALMNQREALAASPALAILPATAEACHEAARAINGHAVRGRRARCVVNNTTDYHPTYRG